MRPRKSLGQNFLRDEQVIRRIVGALRLESTDTVVEIGPGTGALTRGLIETAGRVIAIEFDRDLVPPLNDQFRGKPNFKLLNRDALEVDFREILEPNEKGLKIKLVANLPYNISTPILQRLIDQRFLFSELVLMFQREVVERITAQPGGKERGFLSVMVESAFDTEYLFDVPPDAFFPVPKVWSAIVRLKPRETEVIDDRLFRKLVSVSFAQKRKTILNNLRNTYAGAADLLIAAGIDGKRRAETLTLDEWLTLTRVIANN